MILATTASSIEGYQIIGYKGTAQGVTFEDLLNNTEALGANAVLNVCYDNALSTDTLFHGSAVFVKPNHVPAVLPDLLGTRDELALKHEIQSSGQTFQEK